MNSKRLVPWIGDKWPNVVSFRTDNDGFSLPHDLIPAVFFPNAWTTRQLRSIAVGGSLPLDVGKFPADELPLMDPTREHFGLVAAPKS